jgi:hypothetical protein
VRCEFWNDGFYGLGRDENEERCELSRSHALLTGPGHGAARRRDAK